MSGGGHGVHQVQCRVRAGTVGGALRTDQNHRHGQVLAHVGQGGGGVGQGIGSVSDDNAFNAGLHLLSDFVRQSHVFFGGHVFGEDGEHLFRVQVADVGQFRHSAVEFARRESRNHRTRAVVQTGGDGAAGAQQFDMRQSGSVGEFLLRNLEIGLRVTFSLHGSDGVHIQADVITGNDFQHNVHIVGVFGPGQDFPAEMAAGGLHFRFVPYVHVVFFQYVKRSSFISLKCLVVHFFSFFRLKLNFLGEFCKVHIAQAHQAQLSHDAVHLVTRFCLFADGGKRLFC